MKITDELVLASHNSGKITELRSLLAPFGIKVISAAELNLDEPDETEKTFVGNALLKAKYVAEITGKPSLADDSGLCIDALGGLPGVDTAPFSKSFGSLEECYQNLDQQLQNAPSRDASFHCVLCLYFPDGTHHEFYGRLDGDYVYPARGDDGFCFDFVFQPKAYDKTLAELGRVVKNKISHRALALERFIEECLITKSL